MKDNNQPAVYCSPSHNIFYYIIIVMFFQKLLVPSEVGASLFWIPTFAVADIHRNDECFGLLDSLSRLPLH